MKEEHRKHDKTIWSALLVILVAFGALVLYTRHVGISRQEEQARSPIVARYANYAFAVNLRYPPEWRPVVGSYDRYEGVNGFFSISGGGTEATTIDQMVTNELSDKNKSYGSSSAVLSLRIDKQDARLVMPSPDQRPSMKNQAALIVKYPKPVVVGPNTYYYLVFWADRAHIQDIASSITFINKTQ